MECPSCQRENPTNFRFCGACGTRLPVSSCTTCDFLTPLPFTFCGGCGTALEISGVGHAEERKLATILFADVVGFTRLADRSDPEEMARRVDTAFRQVGEIVVAHGGTIDKYIGDSVMAVFGVPTTHEDDAERAVAAALAIQGADTDLGFSIGVNTGDVMVMAMGGGATTVMGDAVNVAARLEKAAGPGEILVGPLTAELTSARVVYRDRPPMTLKGKRDPVSVRIAVSLRKTATSSEIPTAPLIGRDEEIEFLLAQWRRVCAIRRSGVVLVTGEVGIGKTRLLDELVARIGDDAVVVRSTYPPYGGSGGLRVGRDLVEQLGPSRDDAVKARVRSLSGDLDPSLRGIEAAALRQEQLWALRRLAEDRSREKPLLVLIEDVHMASASIDLLTSIVARMVDLPMLLVFAGRPEGRWLSSFPMANTLRLNVLPQADARRLAESWEPGLTEIDQVLQLSAGNPLFLRELLAVAAQREAGGSTDRRLPVSLRAVVSARLDGLSPAERNALQDLAVIGDLATIDQLVALAGPGAAEGVTSLTSGSLIRHRPDGTLRITEPLLRDIAYDTLPKAARIERHVRVADLVTSKLECSRHLERASELAPHDEQLRSNAAAALAHAGAEAIDGARPLDAIPLLQRAIGLGHRENETILRLASAQLDHDRHAAITTLELLPANVETAVAAERSLILANALQEQDLERSTELFDEAARLWHSVGNQSKEGWSHSNKGVALFMHGSMSDADAELTNALELFRSADDRIGEMATLSFRALVRPDHPDVELWLHESLAFAIELGDRSRHLTALSALAWHHYLRSRLGGDEEMAAARAWIQEARELAEELGWTDFVLQCLAMGSNLARMSGRLDEARELAQRARRTGPVDAAGLRTLRRAVIGSIERDVPFAPVEQHDPYSSIAAVVQVERAIFDGEVDELLRHELEVHGDPLGHHAPIVGYTAAALVAVLIGSLEHAEQLAMRAVHTADRSHAPTASAAAKGVLAECQWLLRGTKPELGPLLSGGFGRAVQLRALTRANGDTALDELRALSNELDAPGLLAGLEVPTAAVG